MIVKINGQRIIGLDRDIIRAMIFSVCDRCTHKTIMHREEGCKVVFDTDSDQCKCKKGYTSYLLLKDESFIEEIIKEGLLVSE